MDWRARGIGLRVGGHRGSSAAAPENTYAAFERAGEDGAAYVETDIRRTADGALVLLHDSSLDRTTDGRGSVADASLDAIRGLDAGSWFGEAFRGQRVPELAAFLRWIEARPSLGAALEVKASGVGGEVARLAWSSPARDRLAIYSFLVDEIQAAKAEAPDLPCLLLLEMTADPGGVMATIQTSGADGADVPWQWDARSLIAEMRQRGLLIGGGTADGPEAAAPLVELGVDLIDTDRPSEMVAALRDLPDAVRP
jgi:glycerophosphoryl diester phosphodiesterase